MNKLSRGKNEKYKRGVELLVNFGLTENEALVYSFLLARGSEAGASAIANAIGIHRQYVYFCLEKLIKLGLVESTPRGKLKRYKALAPEQIAKIAQRRSFEADDIVQELNKISIVENQQNFEVYTGDKQVREYEKSFFSQIKEGDIQYVISGASENFMEYFRDDYEHFSTQGKRKRLITYYIGGSHEKSRLEYAKKLNPNFEFKIMDNMPDGVTSTVIRQNSFILYSLAKPPLVYVIKSEIIFQEYKAYFDMLWKIAK